MVTMTQEMLGLQKKFTIPHEGERELPYRDSKGMLTVGIGWNIMSNPMRNDEMLLRFTNDVNWFYDSLLKYEWFKNLNDARQVAVVDMAFNIGMNGFLDFKELISCLERENWMGAYAAIDDSEWAKKVPCRALEVKKIILYGEI